MENSATSTGLDVNVTIEYFDYTGVAHRGMMFTAALVDRGGKSVTALDLMIVGTVIVHLLYKITTIPSLITPNT